MKPVGTSLPELDRFRDEPYPAPERGHRDLLRFGPVGVQFGPAPFQTVPGVDHLGLPARPRPELRAARPGMEIRRGLDGRHTFEPADGDDLSLQGVPGEHQRTIRVRGGLPSLSGTEVGEKREAAFVEPFEQDGPGAGPASGVRGREHHRVRLGQRRPRLGGHRGRLREPARELGHPGGGEVGLVQPACAVVTPLACGIGNRQPSVVRVGGHTTDRVTFLRLSKRRFPDH